MLKPIMQWAAILFVLFSAGPCYPAGHGGPVAWIDQPLDGSVVPLAPLTITAHATSKAGVQRVWFYWDTKSPAIGYVNGGNLTLVEAEMKWTPPKAGEYTLWVQAEDENGTSGDPALATIDVGGPIFTPLVVLPSKTPTPPVFQTLEKVFTTATPTPSSTALTPSLTVTLPSATLTSTFTPTPGPAGPTLLANANANCRTGPGVDYEIDDGLHIGQVGIIEGRNADNTWVWIREPSGGGGHCWVSASVGTLSGDLNSVLILKSPPTPKPVVSSLPQVSIQIGDATLETDHNPCTNHPKTTPVNATISASATLSKVTLHWSGATSGSISMPSTGGNHYQAILGSFAKAGTLSVWVTAVDKNGAQGASQTISVKITSGCVP